MNRRIGGLGQLMAKMQRPSQPRSPAPLDMGGLDQSLQRSGMALKKGISRMRQMNRGGQVKKNKSAPKKKS